MGALRNSNSRGVGAPTFTPSDWHGGEESPVTNSYPDPRPQVAADGQPSTPSSEAAGAKSGGGNDATVDQGGECAGIVHRHSEQAVPVSHSSVTSSPQTDTAGEVFSSLPPRLTSHQSPGACNSAFCSTRGALPGQAAGRVGAILQTVYEQIRLPNFLLRLLLVVPRTMGREAATSGQDEPLYSHVLAAFSRWLSPKSRRGLLNSLKRALFQRAYRLLVEFVQKPTSGLFQCFEVLSPLAIHVQKDSRRKKQSVVIP